MPMTRVRPWHAGVVLWLAGLPPLHASLPRHRGGCSVITEEWLGEHLSHQKRGRVLMEEHDKQRQNLPKHRLFSRNDPCSAACDLSPKHVPIPARSLGVLRLKFTRASRHRAPWEPTALGAETESCQTAGTRLHSCVGRPVPSAKRPQSSFPAPGGRGWVPWGVFSQRTGQKCEVMTMVPLRERGG